MKQLHQLQLIILKRLMFAPSLKFSQLKEVLDVASNSLTFHLNALTQKNLCVKQDESYRLTSLGKEYANTMDTNEFVVKKQAKIGVMVCATRTESNGSSSVLIQTRTKQPFWWKQWCVTWKIHWWESPLTTARRELYEETWLIGSAKLVKVMHYTEFDYETQKLLTDTYLFLCHIHNPQWIIIDTKEWTSQRVHESKIRSILTNPYRSIDDFIAIYTTCKEFGWSISLVEESQYTADF